MRSLELGSGLGGTGGPGGGMQLGWVCAERLGTGVSKQGETAVESTFGELSRGLAGHRMDLI